jgi:hypothetical protein
MTPVEMKMPVPIISPAINITALNKPICRFNSWCAIAITHSREAAKLATDAALGAHEKCVSFTALLSEYSSGVERLSWFFRLAIKRALGCSVYR